MTSDLLLTLRADEFNVLDGFRSSVQPDGSIRVPPGYDSYVMYGPYWRMKAGVYVVEPNVRAVEGTDPDRDLGVLEICDNGVVVAATPLRLETVLSSHLPLLHGLEIRIRANGNPFVLESVLLVHAPTGGRAGSPAAAAQGDRLALVNDHLSRLAAGAVSPDDAQALRPARPADFDAIWSALTRGAPEALVGRLEDDARADPDREAALEAWVARKSRVRVIDAWGGNLCANAARLEALGLDIAALRMAGCDLHALNERHARAYGETAAADVVSSFPDGPGSEQTQPDWFTELERMHGGFSKLAALTGAAFLTCPFTGETLRSTHGLPVASTRSKQAFAFYRFESVYTFYLIVGGFSGSKMFIFLPEASTLLRLHIPYFEWGPPQQIVAHFLRLMMGEATAVVHYLKTPTQPAMLCGTLDNVGHFFWNEASGLAKYERLGLLRNAEWGLSYNAAVIDPYALLPDDVLPRRRRLLTGEALFRFALDEGLFIVKPMAAHVEDDFAHGVRGLVNAQATAAQKERLARAKTADCLLWIGLRSHNKVWLQQVEGALTVVESLLERYETLAVFGDGTPDCAEVLAEIEARLPARATLYRGVDIPMTETLLWAFEIDLYVTTIGSGLTFTTWLAAKPGVAHSETHHMDQMAYWGRIRPSAPPPLTPMLHEIEDVGERMYCDYRIDPARIVELVNELPLPQRTRGAD